MPRFRRGGRGARRGRRGTPPQMRPTKPNVCARITDPIAKDQCMREVQARVERQTDMEMRDREMQEQRQQGRRSKRRLGRRRLRR